MTTTEHEFGMLIGGRTVPAEGTPLKVLNPATEAIVGRVPDATDAQLQQAVDAAARAFETWRTVPLEERRAAVRGLAGILREHREELAALLTAEQGKPLEQARGEIAAAAAWCEGTAALDFPEEELREDATHRVRIRRVSLGPVAGIVPWNFPVAQAFWKIAPALVTGNTIVIKPSPFTPLSALRIGELLRDALPAGVLNIVTGGDSLGPKLTEHPAIRKIAFTGSTATGQKVMQSASRHLAHLTLELGGNDVAIVLPDADLDTVAESLFWASFRNSGQVCVASKRVYVHEDIYDAFAKRFANVAQRVRVGNGAEAGVQVGPIQNRGQYEKVVALIEQSDKDGLSFLVKGDIPEGPGYFVHPTVVDNPPEDAPIVTVEQFGPVVPLLKWRDEDDVVARANNSEYGLAGSVWGSDLAAAERIAERIDTGTVWINESQRYSPALPFGGHKFSGIGVEHGVEGLLNFTDLQVVSVRKG
ncbi:aldehyde dehydrogenase family protein [Streptomyces sp. NPDC001833]|uniref:aldehyde dehydrogenase family protein n=1 Tax=Streptomyces sp. NPDC001833 TaxID=3154658 RepID=UPI003326A9C7